MRSSGQRERYMSWEKESLNKIIKPKDLANKIALIRKKGHKIATLNGSFDLLHAGHLHILYEGSLQADCFIVALNSDSSIKKYKSENRPIVPLKYRAQMLAALEFVDYVTYFSETDPRKILSIIKPDVHVNGMEYGYNCIEAETVKKYGGRIYLVDRIKSLSTTQIIEKIKCD